jgi:hypothetical protein
MQARSFGRRLLAVLAGLLLTLTARAADHRDLAGEWRFALDRADAGLAAGWAATPLAGTVRLPGLLTAQGHGDPITPDTPWTGTSWAPNNGGSRPLWKSEPGLDEWRREADPKIPYILQPPRHYVGVAWYQRDIEIPADWSDRRVELFLERPHWETRVFLGGREVGRVDRLGVPHVHDLGTGLAPGRHTLTIRVDNRMVVDVGRNSHSVSDHTQGNWNGLVGRLELRATPRVWLDDVQIHPSVAERAVRVEVALGGAADGEIEAVVTPDRADAPPLRATARGIARAGRASLRLELGSDARTWDEFAPHLYRLQVTLRTAAGAHTREARFGLREVTTGGSRLLLNGRPMFLRGTLECAIFPREGHPPTDVASWRRIIRICQDHGLNHIRFHSWCPPAAAFEAADELGFYLQVEASSWANDGAEIGSGRPLDGWLEAETAAILRAYGNHPSFLLMAYGNEPAGAQHKEWLQAWVARWKQRDARRLYTTGAGWPAMPGSDYHNLPQPRIQQWAAGLKSVINARPPSTDFDWSQWVGKHADAPLVSHEIGQWCVYPNFAEIAKYDGFFRARNFEIFRETARRRGLLPQAADFLHASGKLQALCYKADIEAALRTPGFGGFQLLDLHDFPGQGTALVGVLDAFWEQKGYVTPEEYRQFSGPLVPLARLPRLIYTAGERVTGSLLLSHFGAAPVTGPVRWELTATDGAVLGAGEVAAGRVLAPGQLHELGALDVPLPADLPARQLRLLVTVPGTGARNHWDLFVYPPARSAPAPAGVRVTAELDAAAASHLAAGGTVFWLPPPARLRPDPVLGPIQMGFSSIFWNTAWTNHQAPHTLGILCAPTHPALADFPTESHSNWQWWEIVTGAAPFILNDHPGLRPVVQVIDDWFTNRRLGLVFEARVGPGRLLACSADLGGDLAQWPVRRQLRASLLAYAGSPAFQPATELSLDDLRALVTAP